ncbi:hypothetical protein CH380_18490 [Leptospira adleri]|uniref:Uncharacterized protein n=1 Tax=Leptospira adleri TaxID=2023186 RepID=A0A2M9YJL6_9LEPT|nr:hypothetical protein CH380_18490 [Leptospira adleri]PJZ60620.1 hypothetical protein CH376_17395 [Leptospira adleri]
MRQNLWELTQRIRIYETSFFPLRRFREDRNQYSKRVKIKIRYRSAVGLILFDLKIFLRK